MTKQTITDPTAVPDLPFTKLETVQSKLNTNLAKAQKVADRVMAMAGEISTPLFGSAASGSTGRARSGVAHLGP